MKTVIPLVSMLLAACSFSALAQSNSPAQKEISYKADVYPIFSDYCLGCHVPGGKGYEKSGLDLRTYKSLMKGTKFGAVVSPGESLRSTLNVLVSGHSTGIAMPLGVTGGLPKEKVEILNKWVDQGAKNN
jgi:hypothetical protein